MAVITDRETLLSLIKDLCKSKLNSTEITDVDMEIALERYMVRQAFEWESISEEILEAKVDSEELETGSDNAWDALRGKLTTVVDNIVIEVQNAKNPPSSTMEGIIRNYFLPDFIPAI